MTIKDAEKLALMCAIAGSGNVLANIPWFVEQLQREFPDFTWTHVKSAYPVSKSILVEEIYRYD